MPIYADWQGHMPKPVGLDTHNSLRPHRKWHSVAMFTDEDLLVAAATVIVMNQESHKPRNRQFWVRPNFSKGRARYGVSELMKELILDNVDELNLEYRCGGGFRNFFRMTSSDFEILLNLT